MNIIQLPRQSGKTHYLLSLLVNDPNSVMITPSEPMAQFSRGSFMDMLTDAGVAPKEAKKRASWQIKSANAEIRGRQISVMYVDELEYVLANLLNHQVAEATYSGQVSTKPINIIDESEQ